MGHVHVDARVFARRSARVRFLVDTGATYSVVPPDRARRLEAPPTAARFTVTLADGTRRRVRGCTLGVELVGRTAPMTALLVARAEPLLGVEALEALGLRVNPTSRALEPTRAHAVLLVGVRPRGGR